ncbi:MAG: hypothetical protein J5811_08400 [Lachnospiraceae bacterium]|nr:hypothetical protein [Lachnospiraceae bacterium]
MKKYPHLNDIFITKHLKDSLEDIESNRITSIVAPMGYGKTAYIKWCMDEIKKKEKNAVILMQEILNDNPEDFWADLRRILAINEDLIKRMDKIHFPNNSHEVRIVTDIVMDTWKLDDEPVYLIFDNMHYMEKVPVLSIILILSERLPENFHFIMLSRNRIFSDSELLSCGNKLYQLGTEDFKLDDDDLREYVNSCGLELTDEEIHKINEECEGWVSLIYLKLKAYAQIGRLTDEGIDAVNLMEQLVFKKLSSKKKKFLVVNALTEEFTKEQAKFMFEDEADVEDILDSLVEDNSFVSKSHDGLYRYHGMLKTCVMDAFNALSLKEKQEIYARLGRWNQENKKFIEAELNYEQAADYDSLLSCVEEDKGKGGGFDPSRKDMIVRWVKNCPKEILMKHPYALLSFMLSFFVARRLDDMDNVSNLLSEAMTQNSALSEEEKNNIHGERELLGAFRAFNDYTAMNVCQRKALTLMTRTSRVVNREAAWTFGAPSILGMYHRKVGELKKESESIKDGLAAYTQLTDGLGSGADAVYAGEAAYQCGNMMDAELEYHVAIAAAKRKKQYSIILSAEFLYFRIAVFRGDYEGCLATANRAKKLLSEIGDYELRNTYDLMEAWMIGEFRAPKPLSEWVLEDVADMAYVTYQARPQYLISKNECLLAKGEYAKVAATEFEYIPLFESYNMVMPLLYEYLQLAVAHNSMGHTTEARGFVVKAMDLAMPDQIIMPFVEVCDCICDSIRVMNLEGGYRDYSRAILRLSDGYREAKEIIYNAYYHLKDEAINLTDREWEVARLAAMRYTNKEIAEELTLSDYTVKNHLKNIFDKVGIKGNDKNKRIILAEKLHINI